jgi:hypothetical protein
MGYYSEVAEVTLTCLAKVALRIMQRAKRASELTRSVRSSDCWNLNRSRFQGGFRQVRKPRAGAPASPKHNAGAGEPTESVRGVSTLDLPC